ncbi:hypothetical protein O9992_05190 [Vibrio lentus]|nr:hypothetical protein [Vibrio lentus]
MGRSNLPQIVTSTTCVLGYHRGSGKLCCYQISLPFTSSTSFTSLPIRCSWSVHCCARDGSTYLRELNRFHDLLKMHVEVTTVASKVSVKR